MVTPFAPATASSPFSSTAVAAAALSAAASGFATRPSPGCSYRGRYTVSLKGDNR